MGELQDRRYVRAVQAKVSDPAWADPRAVLYPQSRRAGSGNIVPGGRGGFHRPIKVGDFVRLELIGGRAAYGNELYRAYRDFCVSQELKSRPGKAFDKHGVLRSSHKRKPMSYGTFRTYLYMFRKLGLIEYVEVE